MLVNDFRIHAKLFNSTDAVKILNIQNNVEAHSILLFPDCQSTTDLLLVNDRRNRTTQQNNTVYVIYMDTFVMIQSGWIAAISSGVILIRRA